MTAIDTDPDLALAVAPWQEYLTAAQSLDAVRREIAAVRQEVDGQVAAADVDDPAGDGLPAGTWPPVGARSSTGDGLPALRQRLDRQRARLTETAARAGLPSPPLAPSEADLAAARAAAAADPSPANPTQVAEVLLRQCRELLDACDAQLPPTTHRRPRQPRRSLMPAVLAGVSATLVCAGLVLLVLIFIA